MSVEQTVNFSYSARTKRWTLGALTLFGLLFTLRGPAICFKALLLSNVYIGQPSKNFRDVDQYI